MRMRVIGLATALAIGLLTTAQTGAVAASGDPEPVGQETKPPPAHTPDRILDTTRPTTMTYQTPTDGYLLSKLTAPNPVRPATLTFAMHTSGAVATLKSAGSGEMLAMPVHKGETVKITVEGKGELTAVVMWSQVAR
ncbi:hypothetical protein F0L68_32295 [Solihabitans fulvus]|uniref:Uncharacterized protein n=1 Tax=Solihabitans fulvus TaxID=1892852 RepID=A0A5B2WPQ8_9PSEU|nr:hypothetical protein [Solihabitans fulvus]KAA2253943.1 hypothetical protein F0L68_32295 [Solihabitans fulvus]